MWLRFHADFALLPTVTTRERPLLSLLHCVPYNIRFICPSVRLSVCHTPVLKRTAWPFVIHTIDAMRCSYTKDSKECIHLTDGKVHCESKKTRHQTLGHNFSNYYPIFKMFSLPDSAVNLQQNYVEIFHHALNTSLHYLVKYESQKNGVNLKYVL